MGPRSSDAGMLANFPYMHYLWNGFNGAALV